MLIRKLRWEDFNSLKELHYSAYSELRTNPNYGDYVFLNKPPLKDMMDRFVKRYKLMLEGNAIRYVAEENGKLIGFCFVEKKEVPDSEISHIGKLTMRVAIEWRNKRIGTMLLKTTIKDAKGKFEIIEACVLTNNLIAKRLYRKFGFKRWGIAPRYIKRGKHYINREYMSLRL